MTVYVSEFMSLYSYSSYLREREIYIYTHTYIHTYIYMCVFTCVHDICMHIYILFFIKDIYISSHTHIYKNKYVYVYPHIINLYTYTYTELLNLLPHIFSKLKNVKLLRKYLYVIRSFEPYSKCLYSRVLTGKLFNCKRYQEL